MHPGRKIHNPQYVDKFISAKIPNKDSDPDLYKLVSDHMFHGSCGDANPNCTCMVNKKCSKNFPKMFNDETAVDSQGFPVYKRRDNGQYVVKSDIMMDNRTVVPYNKTLLKQFQAHINVEWCNKDGSIKYLFKYINKGLDRATVSLVQNNNGDNPDPNLDEIEAFYDCRYVFACEATWRIFSFDVHYRIPSVIRLAFHLPGEQQVIYGANEDIEDILNKTPNASLMFTGWFECNKNYDLAKTLTYAEFPIKFVWKKQLRKWKPRLRGFAFGKVHDAPPAFDEAYYLRILLNKVKGPECFEDIQTVDGVVCENFRDACYKRGLLDDDKEYIEAIEDASHNSTGYYLRNLFATMLITYSLSRPHFVWENTWQLLVDGLILNEEQLKNLALLEIENFLISNNSSLRRYQQMSFPDMETISRATNPLIVEELSYDTETMNNEFNNLWSLFFFGYGGTGKTYLWKTLSASIRSKGEVVLNVVSSGIASLLLEGGRIAHSRFLIPINLTEDSICLVKGNTNVYEVLKKTSLIIWDEAPMIHKHAFEALDRTLNDVMNGDSGNTSEAVFGGKVVVFCGDFQQIFLVVTNGTRSECVNACINSSYIWSKCKVLKLTKNMRLTVGCRSSDVENIREFADWLLNIGQGNAGGPTDGESVIDIPDDLLILNSVDSMGDLIRFVYPNILYRFNELTYFQDHALLAPLNEAVQEIKERMLALFPGEEVEYLSSDSLTECEDVSEDFDPQLYSPDLLNGLKMSVMPNHILVLKVGVLIILLRNMNHKKGLCNGTRLQVVSLGRRVIEAKVVSGTNIGYRALISRVSLIPTDKKLPFKLKRRQFPISVCFDMTINKSQCRSLSRVGLYLKDPVFSHGQLYVALSRVRSRGGIKLVILDKELKLTNKTTNVIYKEILET
ncbi:ATP-dependent DNA helicase RRM3-like [Bidens hawaiensis]|uniref:ATP-dependent DNA helicase RRM3-like n=1 Tax=Bidens hawaiensis TaxID=980011 RepID=UPI00404B2F88